jgi:aminoglycoside phosphotransferase family enzyme/predicted kinase
VCGECGCSTASGALTEGNDQAEVIAFLSDPHSYSGTLERIERFETHGALVYLAGEEAWKIKRAVRFPYMDFSTLEKRRVATTREVAINQRLAPEIYIGVAPITRDNDGRLQIGGNGEIVEWAVHMRRFEQTALLSHIADAGSISMDLAIALADVVFESHRAAAPVPGDAGAERVEKLISLVGTTLTTVQDLFEGAELQWFSERATDQVRHVKSVLNERAAAGFVRRCHGDLHLNNIVLWRGRPVLFDAIEFDEELATIDTLYDLAFLLMDLSRRRQRAAGNLVLNRYLWRSGADLDFRGLQALPLFLGLRAAIRAMVTAERAQQQPSEDAARARQAARDYLDAANAFLAPPAPQLIVVGGLSGTGKSTLARALAPELGPEPGAVHLRSDLERKRLHGVAETVRLAPEAYTQAASDAVYAVLYKRARDTLAARHAVIVDAVFAKPEERARIETVAVELGVAFQGLWLAAPPERLIERVAARRGDASDATPEIVRRQLAWQLGPLPATWKELDASGGLEDTLRNARAALAFPHSAQLRRPTEPL